MRKFLLAGIALAALSPAVANAKSPCEKSNTGQIVGTVAGAGAGAAVGTAVAGRGDNTEGAIIGGVLGAIIGNRAGNEVDKGNRCDVAYGYYDDQGYWHATAIPTRSARGFYDRDGQWIDGMPSGYYDRNNKWVRVTGEADAAGWVDSEGHWVPASATGYYDRNGTWKTRPANGYYDSRGRWVSGTSYGSYDARGRWVAGDPRYAAGSSWATVDQPGYYDSNGRWVTGKVYGYYDGRGRWVMLDRPEGERDPYQLGAMPQGLDARIDWLNRYVDAASADRRLTQAQTRGYRQELRTIQRDKRQLERSGNRFTAQERRTVDSRLDRIAGRLNVSAYMASR